VILAAALLVPGLWWARRKARSQPTVQSIRITRAGYIGIGTFVAVLMVGFSAEYWVPNPELAATLGRLRFLFFLVATGIGWLIERALAARGIRFTAVVTRNDV